MITTNIDNQLKYIKAIPSEKFEIKSGLKQGNQIFSTLYNLVIEATIWIVYEWCYTKQHYPQKWILYVTYVRRTQELKPKKCTQKRYHMGL